MLFTKNMIILYVFYDTTSKSITHISRGDSKATLDRMNQIKRLIFFSLSLVFLESP